MGLFQKIFKAILPESMLASMEAESRKWMVKCNVCSTENRSGKWAEYARVHRALRPRVPDARNAAKTNGIRFILPASYLKAP